MPVPAISSEQPQGQFLRVPCFCLATIALIHALPKPESGAIRLAMTIAYFASFLVFLGRFLNGFHPYLEVAYAKKYKNCGTALDQTWRRYALSLSRIARIAASLGMAIVGGIALSILNRWSPVLASVAWVSPLLYWGGLLVLLGSPWLFRSQWVEYLQRRRALSEALVLSPPEPQASQPTPLQAGTFQAGQWTWRWTDFRLSGVVLGQPGSGKTACVLNALLEGMIGSAREAGTLPAGLILDPKGDYREKIQALCRKYGREQDLIVLSPGRASGMRWNPLDSDEDVMQLAGRFAAVLQSTGTRAGDNTFWLEAAKRFIASSIELLRFTNAPGDPPSFWQIRELASDMEAVSQRIERLPECAEAELCLRYFAQEWRTMAHEQRSGIQSHITNMVELFAREPYRSVFSGRSTLSFGDLIDQGRILYVDLPVAEKEDIAKIVCTFAKLTFYREVLRRRRKERPSFFLCDEFQTFFTSFPGFGDSDFFERSRESNHANLIGAQNLPSLLSRAEKADEVYKMLGNCAVKLFLRNTDAVTNNYSSELFGERPVSVSQSSFGDSSGRLPLSLAANENTQFQYEKRFPPQVFSELAIPSAADGVNYCEAILLLASRPEMVHRKSKWELHPIV